jgi:cytochrome c oxidase subunit 1
MAVSLAIAIPSAVKVFNWITTMWNGRVRLTAPMLFCVGFVANFIIGGVTGVFLAAIPVNLVLHDTYYVVGHFHYIVMGAIGFAVFAGIYYWYPIVTGKTYQRTLAKWHFWLSMIGTNLTFFAMLLLGYLGMPRRYATYDFPIGPVDAVTALNRVATLGAFLIAIGTTIFLWNVIHSWYEAPTIEDGDPWDLEESDQYTREWQYHERRLETAIADGGEREDSDGEKENPDLTADRGGEVSDERRDRSGDGTDRTGIANTTDTAERND